MKKQNYEEDGMTSLEKEWRGIRKSLLHRLEGEIEWEKKYWEKKAKLMEKRIKMEQALLEQLNLDPKLMKEIGKEDKRIRKELEDFSREHILEMMPDKNQVARQMAYRSRIFNRPGSIQPYFLGSDIVVSNPDFLKGKKGEQGNPSRWFMKYWDKHNIEMGIGGVGETCLAVGLGDRANLIYEYLWDVPEVTGLYNFNVDFYYYGDYKVYASSRGWDCKRAGVSARAMLEITQRRNFHMPVSDYILWEGGSNIFQNEALIGPREWNFDLTLFRNNPVVMNFILELRISAKGSGSYAEISFGEEGNEDLFVYAPVIGVDLVESYE
ncbi:MAG: hypothetical protein H6560_07530 [Lewinellaceae bacterium]|nr:hypothetical protein [Lewinellaceae bacterium]